MYIPEMVVIIIIIFSFSRLRFLVSGQSLENNLNVPGAMIGALKSIGKDCGVVIFYDELLSEQALQDLAEGLNSEGRVSQTVDFITEQFKTGKTPSYLVKRTLRRVYKECLCNVFIVWLKDPTNLYPGSASTHPGWRKQDFVLLAMEERLLKTHRDITALRIWREIPNILGFQNKDINRTNRVHVFTVYPNFKDGKRKFHILNTWGVKQQQFEKNTTLFPEKFNSFNGGELNVGWIFKQPFLIFGDKENPYFDGVDMRLSSLARVRLNYNAPFPKFSDQTGIKENGTWTGLLKYLIDGEIDFAIGGVTITPERLKQFDFCRTYATIGFTFISPLWISDPSVFNVLTKPLSLDVWLALAVVGFFCLCFMKFLAVMENKLFDKTKKRDEKFEDLNFTRLAVNISFMFTIFCQKPFCYYPKSASLKFGYIGIIFFLIILGIVFGARMFSIILLKGHNTSINQIEDLEKSRLPIDIRNYDGYVNIYLQKALKESVWKRVTLIDQNNMSLNSMDEVVRGKRIYIDARPSLDFNARYYYKGARGNKFHLSSEDIVRGNVGWAVRKNWPYREAFDRIIMQAVENGLIKHWMTHYRRGSFGWDDEAFKIPLDSPYLPAREKRLENYDPSENLERKDIKLMVQNFIGVGVIWMIGIIISCLAFIGELILGWVHLLKKPKKEKSETSTKVEDILLDNSVAEKLEKQLMHSLFKESELSLVWADFVRTKTLNRRNKLFKPDLKFLK